MLRNRKFGSQRKTLTSGFISIICVFVSDAGFLRFFTFLGRAVISCCVAVNYIYTTEIYPTDAVFENVRIIFKPFSERLYWGKNKSKNFNFQDFLRPLSVKQFWLYKKRRRGYSSTRSWIWVNLRAVWRDAWTANL